MVTQMPNLEILTSAQAARILGYSVSTISRMAQSGRLAPVAKAPGARGAYFFDREQIEALAEGDAK